MKTTNFVIIFKGGASMKLVIEKGKSKEFFQTLMELGAKDQWFFYGESWIKCSEIVGMYATDAKLLGEQTLDVIKKAIEDQKNGEEWKDQE